MRNFRPTSPSPSPSPTPTPEAESAAKVKPKPEASFHGARRKLTIGSLDTDLTVKAHYNPHELQIEKTIPWGEHNARDNRSATEKKAKPRKNDAEFNGAPSRTMTVELLFDGYETRTSVQPKVEALEDLSSVRNSEKHKDAKTGNDAHRRPHYCVVTWGSDGVPPFRCVIEGLTVKYTMFDADGVPLRAVCTVKLKEANLESMLDTKVLEEQQRRGWADWVPPENRGKREVDKYDARDDVKQRPLASDKNPIVERPPAKPSQPSQPIKPRTQLSDEDRAELMRDFREVNGDPVPPRTPLPPAGPPTSGQAGPMSEAEIQALMRSRGIHGGGDPTPERAGPMSEAEIQARMKRSAPPPGAEPAPVQTGPMSDAEIEQVMRERRAATGSPEPAPVPASGEARAAQLSPEAHAELMKDFREVNGDPEPPPAEPSKPSMTEEERQELLKMLE